MEQVGMAMGTFDPGHGKHDFCGLKAPSFMLQGVKGLSRVLLAAAVVAVAAAVVAVFVLQLAFTCAPVMQSLFASTPGSLGPFHSRNWRRETAQ